MLRLRELHVQRPRGDRELGTSREQLVFQSDCSRMKAGEVARELTVKGPRVPVPLGYTYCGHWCSAAACPCTPSQHAQTPVFWNKSKGLEPPGGARGAGSHNR